MVINRIIDNASVAIASFSRQPVHSGARAPRGFGGPGQNP